MVRREQDAIVTEAEHLQHGEGTVLFHHFMTKEEAYGTGRIFARVTLKPGCSIGVHEHHGEFEGYYILKGEALVTDNGKEEVLFPGDYHMCRDGDSHGIACHGDTELDFIALIISVPKQE